MTADRGTTIERLSRSALDLFEEYGYADTDVDQIAERAETSRRTFFRHFDSKDDAILRSHREGLSTFRAHLPGAASSDAAVALRAVLASGERVLAGVWADPGSARRRYALVFDTPALRERMAATDLAYLGVVEEQMTPSLGPVRAAMVAAAGLAVVNAALRQLAGGASIDDCIGVVTHGSADLRAAVSAWLDDPGDSTVIVISSRASTRDIRAALAPLTNGSR